MFKLIRTFFLISLPLLSACYLNSKDTGGSTADFVSFETDVTTIFTSKCATSGCHTGASPAGNLDLDVAGSDVSTIYTNVQTEINVTTPASSLLLKKASNATPHTGGAVLAESSDDYKTILQWITDGAFNDDCTGVTHSFATDVTPIFTQCTTAGCHDTVTPVLSSNAFDNITTAKDVDTTVPANSKLLRKPLGLDSHGGAAVFSDLANADYKTIFCWIKVDGAIDN